MIYRDEVIEIIDSMTKFLFNDDSTFLDLSVSSEADGWHITFQVEILEEDVRTYLLKKFNKKQVIEDEEDPLDSICHYITSVRLETSDDKTTIILFAAN